MTCLRSCLWSAFGPLLWVMASACNDDPVEEVTPADTEAMAFIVCTPGEELACTCSDASSGTQTCLPSGHEIGPCICQDGSLDETGDPPAGTTTSGGGGETTTGEAGESTSTGADSTGAGDSGSGG